MLPSGDWRGAMTVPVQCYGRFRSEDALVLRANPGLLRAVCQHLLTGAGRVTPVNVRLGCLRHSQALTGQAGWLTEFEEYMDTFGIGITRGPAGPRLRP